jgi:hypothetical protein
MYKKVMKYLVIFLCGYILIKWITIPHPFILSDFFLGLVMNPVKFFAASVFFFIGFLVTGRVVGELLQRTRKNREKLGKSGLNLFFEYISLFITFLLLFNLSWEQTLVFFSLSLLYGMISIGL